MSNFRDLTEKQLEVALLIYERRTIRDIADSTGTSVSNVNQHIALLKKKLGVSSRRELIEKLDKEFKPDGEIYHTLQAYRFHKVSEFELGEVSRQPNKFRTTSSIRNLELKGWQLANKAFKNLAKRTWIVLTLAISVLVILVTLGVNAISD